MMHKIRGFSLVSTIFIVVILSLIGAYIVSLSNISFASGKLTTQGVRAYYAAKSGLEWATFQVVTNKVCPTSPTTLTLNQGGLGGFSVVVTCTSNSYTEAQTYNLFTLTAISSFGAIGSLDYASRQLNTVVIPSPPLP